MQINKFEAVGIFLCVAVMAFALFLMRMDNGTELLGLLDTDSQMAALSSTSDTDTELRDTLEDSINTQGTMEKLIIDDVIIGEGEEAQLGTTVSVHYIGTLQSGQQFDNSYTKGTPFEFTLGEGRVIKGWEEGVLGMKEGGQRILVVPADLAYGSNAIGPIPSNATLVFAIELLEVK